MERAKEKEQPMYVGVDMVKAARWERICEKFLNGESNVRKVTLNMSLLFYNEGK